jgi:hypothetical protein
VYHNVTGVIGEFSVAQSARDAQAIAAGDDVPLSVGHHASADHRFAQFLRRD